MELQLESGRAGIWSPQPCSKAPAHNHSPGLVPKKPVHHDTGTGQKERHIPQSWLWVE